MQMEYYNPPSVAGWKAYYQEPMFYRMWINSTTLPLRQQLSNLMLFDGVVQGDFQIIIEPLELVESLDDPFDPNNLIKEFGNLFFPNSVTDDQVDILKEILIPGLPDFEWTVEYSAYLGDPSNPDKQVAINRKLVSLFTAMLEMPEFQLM